jgi:hypothetical protein
MKVMGLVRPQMDGWRNIPDCTNNSPVSTNAHDDDAGYSETSETGASAILVPHLPNMSHPETPDRIVGVESRYH